MIIIVRHRILDLMRCHVQCTNNKDKHRSSLGGHPHKQLVLLYEYSRT